MSKLEKEKAKLVQEKCQMMLNEMLRDEDNKYCVDCDAKGPRWASWNLGLFLCIRCAGIHRNLGVHISKVKSVNLDTWTPEQVVSMTGMGNSRGRAIYESGLPDNYRRPQTDSALEAFIRAKYEHKKYLAKDYSPPPAPKVDWSGELDELMAKKRAKSAVPNNPVLFPKLSIPTPAQKANNATTTEKKKVVENPPKVTAPVAVAPVENSLFDLGDVVIPSTAQAQSQQAQQHQSNELLLEELSLETNNSANLQQQQQQQQKMTKESILSLYGNLGGGGGGNNQGQPQMQMPLNQNPFTMAPQQQPPPQQPQQQQQFQNFFFQ